MATKSKKDGGQRYDWNLIMTEYVTNSDSSLEKIAKKYGIRLATVKEKSSADSWFATKKEYQKKVRQKACQKLLPKKANELAGLVTISDHIEKAILKAIEDDPLYFYKHIISENLSEKDAELSILNVKAMKDMMRVVKDVEDVKRSINEIKREDQRIAAERLQLERERFEFEKQKAEILKPDSTNSIRIEGFEVGWSE
jgi:hypothetical protein